MSHHSKKVLIYVQHLLGVGHLKRIALIAKETAASGVEVLLLSGGGNVPHIDWGRARFFQLPPAFSDAAFSNIFTQEGAIAGEAWKKNRADMLIRQFYEFKPDILLIEMYPFGRRMFRFELLPLLERARRAYIPVACSVRDVLVKKSKPERDREIVDVIRTYFDLVLVHGDPAFCTFNFSLLSDIEEKVRYTGYVTPKLETPIEEGEEILVSAGGGAAGFAMMKHALSVKRDTIFAHAPWRVITGPNIGENAYRTLAELGDADVVLEKFRPDFLKLLARCRLSLSQGGYNTILEILQCRKPALIVPFAEGEESEQQIRAERLAKMGLIECLSLDKLPEMAKAIDRAGQLKPPHLSLDVQGAARTAAYLQELAHGR